MMDQLTRATELAATNAAAADHHRRLDDEVVAGLVAAGFPAHFVPAEFGGRDGTFRDLVRDVARIGAACSSAAWYGSLGAAVGRIAGFLPRAGRDLLWADGPDVLLAGALVPSGRAERVPGGWRLSGRWPYVSAVEHAAWTLARSTEFRGEQAVESRFFLLPRNSYRTTDSWRSAGMRATASNDLHAADVFVAEECSFPADDVLAGCGPRDEPPRPAVPLRAVNGLSFAAPMLGAARGALAGWWDLAAARPAEQAQAATEGEMAVVRAECEIDAAELLLDRVAEIADAGHVTQRATLRSMRDCAMSAELLTTAINRLVRSAGTRGQDDTCRLHRFARDVTAAGTHTMLRFGPAAAAWAGNGRHD
ncbi:hydrolase [Saccharopolyspora gloriosae]|uniref:hydrolase n=1 Tax=Saccharopolyspora gloriosae TaxID=455344 RepID=UPI001FB7735D|nr:hydrolase [Saccharopolyspora gloriosae]